MKDAVITQSIKRVFTPILLWLLFSVPSVAHDRLPQAVPNGALALVPDLLGDEVAVASKGPLEALDAIKYVHPHGVGGTPEREAKPALVNTFPHLAEG